MIARPKRVRFIDLQPREDCPRGAAVAGSAKRIPTCPGLTMSAQAQVFLVMRLAVLRIGSRLQQTVSSDDVRPLQTHHSRTEAPRRGLHVGVCEGRANLYRLAASG